MARRAAERDISLGEDPSGTESLAVQRVGLASGPRGEDGGGAPGGGSAAGVPGGGDVIGETFARRRSFVAKRGWGSMKLVEVRNVAICYRGLSGDNKLLRFEPPYSDASTGIQIVEMYL